MHTIYCWNNLFYYNVQLKLSTFFPLPTHISLAVLSMLKKCTKKDNSNFTHTRGLLCTLYITARLF